MAFNPAYQLRRTKTNTSLQTDSSSLIERANSLLSESQSSWVLFSPSMDTQSAVNVDSDILSLTVDSQQEDSDQSVAEYDSEGQEDEEIDEDDDDEIINETLSRDIEEDDSLIDHYANPSASPAITQRLEQLILNYTGADSSLRKRINEWKSSQDVMPASTVDEDNIASWDLDEGIVSEILSQSQASAHPRANHQVSSQEQTQSASLLYTSSALGSGSSRDSKHYGNDVFKNYSKKDIMRFKMIAKNLKTSLNRKDDDQSSSLTYLIMRLFEKQQEQREHEQLLQQQQKQKQRQQQRLNFQHKRYSTILNDFSNLKENRNFLSSVIANQLRNSTFSHRENDYYGDQLENDRYSSTASSSLVVCSGMGANSSWNDI
ncbi:hypothetical protein CLIB1423_01S03664 [[Candida] railenensis]|uniref:Uncharacterized protein n=1 Tax=[Candida] railenensis TaxID=45579 RepID=A0A9P0QK65_9ASCO|nr:hypothetical protein CLIB1423_01S03664 [[Candida] railenensis]